MLPPWRNGSPVAASVSLGRCQIVHSSQPTVTVPPRRLLDAKILYRLVSGRAQAHRWVTGPYPIRCPWCSTTPQRTQEMSLSRFYATAQIEYRGNFISDGTFRFE